MTMQLFNRLIVHFPLCLLVAGLLLASGGCNRGPKLHPVTGTVLLDGKPLAEAGVRFEPTSKEQEPGVGGTDADGRFQLKTRKLTGVPLGTYKVGISKVVWLPGKNEGTWRSPKKYGDPATSGFTAEVTPEKFDFEFNLTSK
jgi:hypothetical protein